jgi:CIC family chloride channel protein
MNDRQRQSLAYLSFILPLAIISGLLVSATVTLFNIALAAVQHAVPLLPHAEFLLPAAGALVTGSLILRFRPCAGGEGVPMYIIAVNRDGGRMKLLETILRFPATVLTLGSFGSGGIVGPLIGMGSGVTSSFSRWLLPRRSVLREGGLRTAAICGAGAAIGSIFHAPLAGGIFAAEVLRRENLRYSDLFPAILASAAGTAASMHLFGQEAVFAVQAPEAVTAYRFLPWFLLAAAASGAAGMIFIHLFEVIAKLLSKVPGRQPGRALVGAVAICVLLSLTGRGALGVSMDLFDGIAAARFDEIANFPFSSGTVASSIALLMLVKMVATSFTIGSGMSAGLTGPLVILGVGAGALMSTLAGIAPGDPGYHLFLACALSAMLGAAMNVPIAAVLLSIELFGASYAIPALTGGIVSFLLYKTRSVYSTAQFPHLSDLDEG